MNKDKIDNIVNCDDLNKEKKFTSPSSFVRSLDLDCDLSVQVAQKDIGEEGVVIWDAALVLAYFLEKHKEELRLPEGINVLELGSGTGAVGLVAAALGANCVITDLDRLVPLLEESISLNDHIFSNKSNKIKAKTLHWGNTDHLQSFATSTLDLILLADCIYYEASTEPLVETLVTLSSFSGCPVLLSYENRDEFATKKIVRERFFELVSKSFNVTQYNTDDCHEVYSSDDIKVIRLDPRK